MKALIVFKGFIYGLLSDSHSLGVKLDNLRAIKKDFGKQCLKKKQSNLHGQVCLPDLRGKTRRLPLSTKVLLVKM